MYITVQLLTGYHTPLTYKIPPSWSSEPLVGQIVVVPLQKRTVRALVCAVSDQLPFGSSFVVREALSKETAAGDELYHSFMRKLSDYYALDSRVLYRRVSEKTSEESLLAEQAIAEDRAAVRLTDEQQYAVDQIVPDIGAGSFRVTLLHGVTGSGKTEVYKRLITAAQQQGRSTLLLLPEVSLAVNFTRIMRAFYGTTLAVYGFHSATPAAEKRQLWDTLLAQQPALIIGVHLPVFLPIARLGLIIVDEEHEIGYQEKKHPRINTKEAALMRAQHYKIPIVLGSATPSVSSLYNVQERGWRSVQLKQRFAGAFPAVTHINLLEDRARPEFWISSKLQKAIAERLARQEQVILFLNRRGYSFFVQCGSCSFIFSCTSCSVSLTHHATSDGGEELRCHYCGFACKLPESCPGCKSSGSKFLKKGIGTQQMVSVIKRLFPEARVGRADADATKDKKRWQQTCDQMLDGSLDILIGTQTITKGYHFPKVTLVGIIWAELNLAIPFYNASEVTLQQLIQVAGRAGRAVAGKARHRGADRPGRNSVRPRSGYCQGYSRGPGGSRVPAVV